MNKPSYYMHRSIYIYIEKKKWTRISCGFCCAPHVKSIRPCCDSTLVDQLHYNCFMNLWLLGKTFVCWQYCEREFSISALWNFSGSLCMTRHMHSCELNLYVLKSTEHFHYFLRRADVRDLIHSIGVMKGFVWLKLTKHLLQAKGREKIELITFIISFYTDHWTG